jgi:hypothetical protein
MVHLFLMCEKAMSVMISILSTPVDAIARALHPASEPRLQE